MNIENIENLLNNSSSDAISFFVSNTIRLNEANEECNIFDKEDDSRDIYLENNFYDF